MQTNELPPEGKKIPGPNEWYDFPKSHIKRAKYDPEKKILTIHFMNEKSPLYAYEEVPPEIFAEFIMAEVAGKYFHSSIRSKFKGSIVGR
jgi:hypothetical protein